MRLGAVITVAGMIAGLVALSPILSGRDLPSWLWWLAMSAGVGLLLVLLGLRRAHLARRRLVAAASRRD